MTQGSVSAAAFACRGETFILSAAVGYSPVTTTIGVYVDIDASSDGPRHLPVQSAARGARGHMRVGSSGLKVFEPQGKDPFPFGLLCTLKIALYRRNPRVGEACLKVLAGLNKIDVTPAQAFA
jgi:hypothetical protein